MNDLIAASGKPIDLEAVLLELAKYGSPRVLMINRQWHACCEMNTIAKGCEFNVRSEFKHDTALSAATQCLERARSAVKDAK